ncbi:MAG: 50S ribosomal protein L17 [Pseudobdellovibrionaceae bacterium]
MSRHRRKIKNFSRKFNARKALFRGLVDSLVEHERITTTVEKAKELRRHVEKAITVGKDGDLAARRLLLSRYPQDATVAKIMGDISPRFKSRPGGYTRIIKIGRRPGDTAEMAFIEFVDYDYTKVGAEGEVKKTTKKAAKGKKKAAAGAEVKPTDAKKQAMKMAGKLVAAKKKSVRKMQVESRRYNRDV